MCVQEGSRVNTRTHEMHPAPRRPLAASRKECAKKRNKFSNECKEVPQTTMSMHESSPQTDKKKRVLAAGAVLEA